MTSSASSELTISRRDRNKRDKRNRIVSAARNLFRTQGYASTTTQQIAKAAHVATGTLFLYARSKEDLLILVFSHEMSELIESTYDRIQKNQPVLNRVLKLFQGFIRYHARDVDIARELIRELTFLSNPERVQEGGAIAAAILDKLRLILIDARDRGEIDKQTDENVLARVLFSIYYQQLQGWLGGFATQKQFQTSLKEMLGFVLESAGRKTAGEKRQSVSATKT